MDMSTEGIPASRLPHLRALLDARTAGRGLHAELLDPDPPCGPACARRLRALLPPGRVNSFDYRMDPVPAVGEHTQAILRELGRSDAQIARLKESGAI